MMDDKKVRAVHIYPGGRRVEKDARVSWISKRENAIEWLAGGSAVYVMPEDVEYVLANIVLDREDECDGR